MVAALRDAGLAGSQRCWTSDAVRVTWLWPRSSAARIGATGVDLGRGAIDEARVARRRARTRRPRRLPCGRRLDDVPMPERRRRRAPSRAVLLPRRGGAPREHGAGLGRVFAFTAPSTAAAPARSTGPRRGRNAWYRLRDAKFRGFRVADPRPRCGRGADRGGRGSDRLRRERRRLVLGPPRLRTFGRGLGLLVERQRSRRAPVVSSSRPRAAASAAVASKRSAKRDVARCSADSASRPSGARHGDDGEEDVAELLLGADGVLEGLLQLGDLLPDLRERGSSVEGHSNPQPAARRCTFEARARAGSVGGIPSATARRDRRAPRPSAAPSSTRTSLGAGDLGRAEDVRVAVDELADEPSATSSTSHRPSSAAICAWKVTCSRRSPSSSRIASSSSSSIAASSSCVSSSRCRASVRWVCSRSHGHPSGARAAPARGPGRGRARPRARRAPGPRARLRGSSLGRSHVDRPRGVVAPAGSVLVMRTTVRVSGSKPPEPWVDLDAPLLQHVARRDRRTRVPTSTPRGPRELLVRRDLLVHHVDHVPPELGLHGPRRSHLPPSRGRPSAKLSANWETGVEPSDPPFWAALGSVETSSASARKSSRVAPGAVTCS